MKKLFALFSLIGLTGILSGCCGACHHGHHYNCHHQIVHHPVEVSETTVVHTE